MRLVRRSVLRRDIVLVVAALMLGAALGRSLVSGQIMVMGLVAGVAFIVVLAQAAWLPYVAPLVIVATFAEPYGLPQFGIPGNPFLSDLVLIAAFAAWLLVLRNPAAHGPSAFPLAPQAAVAAFLFGGIVGLIVARGNGISTADALGQMREIVFYATFWLALTAFADPRGRAVLLRAAVCIAVVLVFAQVAQGLLGPGRVLFYSDDPLRIVITCAAGPCADPWAEGFPRVRPPGLSLVYVVACFAGAYLLFGPPRRRLGVGLLLGVCVVGLLVSLNRNMLVGVIVGLLLAGLLAARRGRFAATVAVAALVVIISLAAAGEGGTDRESTILGRVLSLTSVSDLESSSTVTDRLDENNHALETLSDTPLVGIGWGVPYGNLDIKWRNGELRTESPLYIHNQYLGVWMRTGLIGLAAILAAFAISLVYGTRYLRRRRHSDDAWLGAGVIAAVTAFGISSLVGQYILNPSPAPILAGLFALAVVLQRELLQGELRGV